MDGEHNEGEDQVVNENEENELQNEAPNKEGEGQDNEFDIEEVEMSDITGPEVK